VKNRWKECIHRPNFQLALPRQPTKDFGEGVSITSRANGLPIPGNPVHVLPSQMCSRESPAQAVLWPGRAAAFRRTPRPESSRRQYCERAGRSLSSRIQLPGSAATPPAVLPTRGAEPLFRRRIPKPPRNPARQKNSGRTATQQRSHHHLSAGCSRDYTRSAAPCRGSSAVQFVATRGPQPPQHRRRDGLRLAEPESAPGGGSFSPFSRQVQQGFVSEQGTELLRAVVSADKPRELLEPGSVSAG
jgi:hypothetical protein